ncbi:sigma-70 family RNA polymerase sigma factor [Azoarcus indigens]|uniref:FecR family protein n=1 Tax=Azoarcus indigens TaxID=29545 RepID=A0A4R6E720_9RHOO|nr:sigma-70 family RNA polymerase sigma factor [Azoarcus indigens]NMG64004.1 sigma-70 family RNA polymerase sigma factor [Azoarcus indigens]TDN53720.1 FecR family protein [Azoarcus indigens]
MSAPAAVSPLLASFHAAYRDLVRFLTRRTGCAETAADLAHETWLRLAERERAGGGAGELASAAGEGGDGRRAYVFAVAANLAVDHLRRGGRSLERFVAVGDGLEDLGPAVPDVADTHLYRQALEKVLGALNTLPPRTRDVFLAHRLDGTCHEELARSHGVSVKTVERDVIRAMDCVQAALLQWRGSSAAPRRGRRKALSALLGFAGLGLSGGLGWQAWRQWVADFRLELATATGRFTERALPDGSRVQLDADSRLELSYYLARRHAVLLRGAAFFAVARDEARPFVVDALDARITVLGTRFAVDVQGGAVAVAVESGRVRVAAGDGELRELGAGERLRLQAGGGIVASGQAAEAAPWREGWLDFDGVALGEAVARLGRYRAQAVAVAPEAATLPVLGRVRIAHSEQWLQLLPRSLPVTLRSQPGGGLLIARR